MSKTCSSEMNLQMFSTHDSYSANLCRPFEKLEVLAISQYVIVGVYFTNFESLTLYRNTLALVSYPAC